MSSIRGEAVRAVGFARVRRGAEMRPTTGSVKLSIVAHGRTLVTAAPKLDAAGAFSSEIPLPADAPAGDAAVLASTDGATGGAALHVAAVGDATLAIVPACGASCAPDAEIPVGVTVVRNGVPLTEREIHVRVIRTPHVLPPGTQDDAIPWATTAVLDRRVRTDATGAATVTLPAPADGLASTYGITAQSGSATASMRLVTPTGRIALAVAPERSTLNVGEAATIDVRGFDAIDGAPAPGVVVHVRLMHGPNVQESVVTLDPAGRARATFRSLVPGTSLVTATEESAGGARLRCVGRRGGTERARRRGRRPQRRRSNRFRRRSFADKRATAGYGRAGRSGGRRVRVIGRGAVVRHPTCGRARRQGDGHADGSRRNRRYRRRRRLRARWCARVRHAPDRYRWSRPSARHRAARGSRSVCRGERREDYNRRRGWPPGRDDRPAVRRRDTGPKR